MSVDTLAPPWIRLVPVKKRSLPPEIEVAEHDDIHQTVIQRLTARAKDKGGMETTIDYVAVVTWMKYKGGMPQPWQVILASTHIPEQIYVLLPTASSLTEFTLEDIQDNVQNADDFPYQEILRINEETSCRRDGTVRVCPLDSMSEVLKSEIYPLMAGNLDVMIGCSPRDYEYIGSIFPHVERMEDFGDQHMKDFDRVVKWAMKISTEQNLDILDGRQ